MLTSRTFIASVAFALILSGGVFAADRTLHSFKSIELTGTYFSEGANAGDLNNDGNPDAVYGPFWFEGPDFQTKHELYEPVPQNMEGYANNFFSWVYDFDGDQWNDVFVVGFPGTPAYVYRNPGQDGQSSYWEKLEVFDWVSNESPQLINLIGDERPELVCTREGFFGFATVNWDKPFDTWTFHQISEKITAERFGHGLGIGDVNGDGLLDIIHSQGWFQQPVENPTRSRWMKHDVKFSNAYGGAEMYAYDVDGDGDNDVITSHAAHDFGLGWYEQVEDSEFKHHLIMGSHPSENHYGVVISELHSVNLVDMDGDGLKDIVTGKTYYSHHQQSPMWDAGAVVYWFKLVRGKDGVDWIPYQADADSGIGRQLTVTDVNKDGKPDIVVGGMKGGHVLVHMTKTVDEAAWLEAQPTVYEGPALPSVQDAQTLRGPKAKIDIATGTVRGGIEAESLSGKATSGTARVQAMGNFKSDVWSGHSQLFWQGGKPGDTLTLPFNAPAGTHDLTVTMTCAADYAIIELLLNGKSISPAIDLFNNDVITTGSLEFPDVTLKEGENTLAVRLLGANPNAQKAYFFGIDYLQVK